jgi:hypothetical protein
MNRMSLAHFTFSLLQDLKLNQDRRADLLHIFQPLTKHLETGIMVGLSRPRLPIITHKG